MAFDVVKWLREDLGYTEDEAKDLAPKFADRADKLEKGQLRQADYSRVMNEGNAKVKKLQDDLSAANERLIADMAEWAEQKSQDGNDTAALKKKVDDSEAAVFKLQQKLTRLAEDAGIDPKTVLEGEVIPPKKEEPPTFDPNPLIQQMGGIADYMLTLNAELPAIAQEHFELTGERLNT